jgi:hypothetical protein
MPLLIIRTVDGPMAIQQTLLLQKIDSQMGPTKVQMVGVS